MNPEDAQLAREATLTLTAAAKKNPKFNQIFTTIKRIYHAEGHIAYGEEHGNQLYHFYQNETYPKGVYRVTSAKAFRSGVPEWRILFAVTDFEPILGPDIYLSHYSHNTLRPELMLLAFSSGKGDGYFTLEFDLNRREIIKEGFNLPLSSSFIHYRDENSAWVVPAWDESQRGAARYGREVRLWRRGHEFADSPLIFKGGIDTLMVEAWRYLDAHGSPLDLVRAYHSLQRFTYYVISPDLNVKRLNLPQTTEICGYLRGCLILHLKADWQREDRFFAAGSVIAAKLNKGQLKEFFLLFEPAKNQVVETIETSRDYVFIHYLDCVKSRASVFRFDPPEIVPVSFPALPAVNFELIDQPWRSNLFYVAANDLIHPPILYSWDAKKNELSVLRREKSSFTTTDLKLEQFWAKAEDGVLIPYFWCGKEATMTTPTLIDVYGGFGVNQLPHYMPLAGKLWLEAGGALVIANVRGGAELGPAWHDAALRENKEKSVTDLEAVIKALHHEGKTSPRYTAIEGGSHGGLIALNLMTRAPGLLQAVIADAPICDLAHYRDQGGGALWRDEYGDPDDPKVASTLDRLTVFNHLKDAAKLPRLLLMARLHDERVNPEDVVKLYRQLSDAGAPVSGYFSAAGGHELMGTEDEEMRTFAYLWFFLYNALS